MRKWAMVFMAAVLAAAPVWADAAGDALRLVNQNRVAAGCGALTLSAKLQTAAEGHARAMAERNFFSHTGKDGSNMARRIKAQGYSGRKLAENIAAGQDTPAKVVAAWMSSAGHRRNMLDCDFTDTGLAMVFQGDDAPIKGNTYPMYYYWVQTFGQR